MKNIKDYIELLNKIIEIINEIYRKKCIDYIKTLKY